MKKPKKTFYLTKNFKNLAVSNKKVIKTNMFNAESKSISTKSQKNKRPLNPNKLENDCYSSINIEFDFDKIIPQVNILVL